MVMVMMMMVMMMVVMVDVDGDDGDDGDDDDDGPPPPPPQLFLYYLFRGLGATRFFSFKPKEEQNGDREATGGHGRPRRATAKPPGGGYSPIKT